MAACLIPDRLLPLVFHLGDGAYLHCAFSSEFCLGCGMVNLGVPLSICFSCNISQPRTPETSRVRKSNSYRNRIHHKQKQIDFTHTPPPKKRVGGWVGAHTTPSGDRHQLFLLSPRGALQETVETNKACPCTRYMALHEPISPS